MRTFFTASAPTYVTSSFSTVPQTGAANNLAIAVFGGQDVYTMPGSMIDSYHFTGDFTIEMSFRMDATKSQIFVGKDDKPTANPQPPFTFKGTVSDNLNVELLDGSGTHRSIASTGPITHGEWCHAAAVSSGTTLSLYLKGPGDPDYVLQGTAVTTGGLFNSTGTWTVGCGMWDAGISDFAEGQIDEVRISSTALTTGQFLNSIPEPSSVTLLLGGVVALALLRRRQKHSS